MRAHLLSFFLIFIVHLNAQDQAACLGNRYQEEIFSDVTLTEGIKYSQGLTWSGVEQELLLDIYEPSGDIEGKRAAIIFAFGGSYIEGDRKDVSFLCETFARRGYVAVAIDYRLYDGPLIPIPSAETFQNVVIRSVHDMKAAVRFLKEDAGGDDLYGIDPDFIYVGGISAGSITACHTAFLDLEEIQDTTLLTIIDDLGGLEGPSDTSQYDSSVKGLVNYSGGLNVAEWIDGNDVPFISVHDRGDMIVPYGSGFATISMFGLVFRIIEMDGSARLQEEGDIVGLENQLITIEGNGHVSYFFDQQLAVDIIRQTSSFVKDITCPTLVSSDELVFEEDFLIYPNPSNGILNLGEGAELFDVQIFDVNGRLLLTEDNTSQLDLGLLQNGQYFIQARERESNKLVNEVLILSK
jgi:hypothetical protein